MNARSISKKQKNMPKKMACYLWKRRQKLEWMLWTSSWQFVWYFSILPDENWLILFTLILSSQKITKRMWSKARKSSASRINWKRDDSESLHDIKHTYLLTLELGNLSFSNGWNHLESWWSKFWGEKILAFTLSNLSKRLNKHIAIYSVFLVFLHDMLTKIVFSSTEIRYKLIKMVSYPIESLKTMRMYEFAYKNSLYVAVILNNVCLFDSATNIN